MPDSTKQQFSLSTIFAILAENELDAARQILISAVGCLLKVSGKVGKVIRRDGCRLFVQSEACGREVNVFANFPGDASQFKERKIRKGSLVTFTGKFRTLGQSSICMSDCALTEV